jgi:hypothetical protein
MYIVSFVGNFLDPMKIDLNLISALGNYGKMFVGFV